MADIRDILDIEVLPASQEVTKETILGDKTKKKILPIIKVPKRPEGMSREVFALLYNDKKDAPPLFPTDTTKGYKQKAKLGMQHARSWTWMPFTNPARKDGAVFYHWRRTADENKEYQFAKFNKQVPIPTYTEVEYVQCLTIEAWSREETDHLLDLARRFDLRFIIMNDRWDRTKFKARTVEELKERYYGVCGLLTKLREGKDTKVYVFDADHEKRRKEQLQRLYDRAPEQIEEERTLMAEVKKIEIRKRDRERKQQDLQRLISAADNSQAEARKAEKKMPKRKSVSNQLRSKVDPIALETAVAGIKFPDPKTIGISIRSHRMKLPVSVGLKKAKAIEQIVQEIPLELNPIPTDEIIPVFNDLRSDILLFNELKMALAASEFEIETLRHQYEALNPGKTLIASLMPVTKQLEIQTVNTPTETKTAEMIDVVGSPGSVF